MHTKLPLHPIVQITPQGKDSAFDTACQRSWVYSHDSVIKYHREGVPVAPAVEELSIRVGEEPATQSR